MSANVMNIIAFMVGMFSTLMCSELNTLVSLIARAGGYIVLELLFC